METAAAVKPSEPLSPFRRRRPLRSRTLHTLTQILSHCNLQPTLGDSEVSELRPVNEANGLDDNDVVKTVDGVVVGDADSSVQETEIAEKIGVQDGGDDREQVTGPELSRESLVIDGEGDVDRANDVNVGEGSVDGNEAGDFQMDDLGLVGDLDKEFSIEEFSEVLESYFGMDMVVESSKLGEDGREDGGASMTNEVHHQLQLKEMEMEKLISSSVAVNSSNCPAADEEMEEGEISGEEGVANESFDVLSEEAVLVRGEDTKLAHEEHVDKDEDEAPPSHRESGHCREDICEPSISNIENNDKGSLDMGVRATTEQVQNGFYPNLFGNSRYLETWGTDPKPACLERQPPSDRIVQGNATESQISAATEKDGNSRKKRKRGSLTEERKAKKKKKERRKRAEKNREAGVKRLKLQPVLKPKTIAYCRHYLQGRCHEGEKCKFSHDTIPLTKSKPCSHFARHCCMKGDDCPFDHQLSKYPCKNYAATGFCSRGSDCLFSHEMPANQSSPMIPNTAKPEESVQHRMSKQEGSISIPRTNLPQSKFPTSSNNFNSIKQANGFQNADVRFGSSRNSPVKEAEQLAPKPDPRTTLKTPKGIKFLLNAGTSVGGSSNQSLSESSAKLGDGVQNSKKTLEVPGDGTTVNEKSVGLAPKRPRGINFLSFAQSSLDVAEGQQTCSSSDKDAMTTTKQGDQSATGILQLPNQEATKVLSLNVTQHINSPLLGKSLLNASTVKEQASLHLKEDKRPLSLPLDTQNTMSSSQEVSKMPSFSYVVRNQNMSSSFRNPFLSNTSSLVQKAVQSTLAFAAKFDHNIRLDSSKGDGTSS